MATPESVARILGYTEKEQVLAMEILERFTWRQVAQPAAENINKDKTDSVRKEEDYPDDLPAAS